MKLLKDKTQFHVAEALDEYLSQQKSLSTGVKGVNFYVRNTVLRFDRGSQFINAAVLDVCGSHGCIQEYSCPGQLGKYQNGVVKRRIKEIGRMGRAMMFTAEAPDLANAYCILQAVDILNMLLSTANPGLGVKKKKTIKKPTNEVLKVLSTFKRHWILAILIILQFCSPFAAVISIRFVLHCASG